MAKKMPIGICKLCLQTRELCDSHIIPEFAYKDVYVYPSANNQRLQKLTFEKGAEPELTRLQKGIRERLLCKDCEGKLSVWEKYVVEQLRSLTQGYTVGFIRSTVDYDKLRLFQLSILWRLSICQDTNWHFALGVHSETLRQMIEKSNTGKHYHYPCVMALLLNDAAEAQNGFILPSEGKRVNGLRVYRIIFSGIIWTFFVGSESHRINDTRLESSYLQPDGTLTIIPAQMNEIEFLMKGAERIWG